jgi:tryptophan-rich sensory protein
LPTLDQPSFQPPDWVFGPVWTVLYALIGVAWHLSRRAPTSVERSSAERWLTIQMALNGLWSELFFGRQRIGLALVDSIALTASAGLLLCPYLVWVAFATALNTEVWRRNRH